jgi:zinc/manganese transport system ATP-binding protein/zinc transport system ATP-binding protein
VLHLLAELNRQGITILMTTHDLNAAAAHLPWVICLNRRIVAQGAPEVVFTEATLNATYHGEMMVIHHDGMILIQQRPHAHTYRDLLPNPVVGHTSPPTAAGSTPEIKGVVYEPAA